MTSRGVRGKRLPPCIPWAQEWQYVVSNYSEKFGVSGSYLLSSKGRDLHLREKSNICIPLIALGISGGKREASSLATDRMEVLNLPSYGSILYWGMLRAPVLSADGMAHLVFCALTAATMAGTPRGYDREGGGGTGW